jgi:glycosyltransferase involved in cell wall biosynthesis
MKKGSKRILIITDGNKDHSSSRIRILQYIPHIESEGFSVKWIPRIPVKKAGNLLPRILFALTKKINLFRIYIAVATGNFELLFIQRFFLPNHLILKCKKKCKKIIFDFDDAIYISDKDNQAEMKTVRMIQAADLIITSCNFLKNYVVKYNPNTVVITSPVDAAKIVPGENSNSKVIIGWIGSQWTSKYLSMLEPVFHELSKKYKFRLLLVGAGDSVNFNCETTRVSWSLETENKYLNKMDIGIMPLFDNEFERAKGGFKLLQYMAAGKPVLASPVGINKDIVIHGENGFLCESEKDWYTAFCDLMDDGIYRKRMGKRGRELILEKYGMDVCAVQFIKNLKKQL